MRIEMLLGISVGLFARKSVLISVSFSGERDSLIARDQEERQQAMYKYQRVDKFRRQQSPLWNALHPTIVMETNFD